MNLIEEIIKCQKDFNYFAETYLKIIHPVKGLISFYPYDFQKRLIKTYDDNRFVIVKKFRNGGFSTCVALYGLWLCMFNSDRRILYISKTDKEAVYLGRIVDRAIQELPEQFQFLLTKSNDHRKDFVTNSNMCFLTPTTGMRGKMSTHLIIDESAFIPNMDEHWKSMYPTIFPANGKCFVVSTVNGLDNWFAKTYSKAVNGINNFRAFDCKYTEHPDYNNEEWINNTRKNLGEKNWMQEMECCFTNSTPTRQDSLRDNLNKILNNLNLSEKDMLKQIKAEVAKFEEV